jgi:hypothetical protein
VTPVNGCFTNDAAFTCNYTFDGFVGTATFNGVTACPDGTATITSITNNTTGTPTDCPEVTDGDSGGALTASSTRLRFTFDHEDPTCAANPYGVHGEIPMNLAIVNQAPGSSLVGTVGDTVGSLTVVPGGGGGACGTEDFVLSVGPGIGSARVPLDASGASTSAFSADVIVSGSNMGTLHIPAGNLIATPGSVNLTVTNAVFTPNGSFPFGGAGNPFAGCTFAQCEGSGGVANEAGVTFTYYFQHPGQGACDPYSGFGLVNFKAAVANQVLSFTQDGPGTLSFSTCGPAEAVLDGPDTIKLDPFGSNVAGTSYLIRIGGFDYATLAILAGNLMATQVNGELDVSVVNATVTPNPAFDITTIPGCTTSNVCGTPGTGGGGTTDPGTCPDPRADTTPPVCPPDMTVVGQCGGTVVALGTPTDNCAVASDDQPAVFGFGTFIRTVTDTNGNTCTQNLTVLEPARVVILPPIKDDNVADDPNTDADVVNKIKAARTYPTKAEVRDCNNVNVTTAWAPYVTAALDITQRLEANPTVVVNDVTEESNGVSCPGGSMDKIDEHFQCNVNTSNFPAGTVYNGTFLSFLITITDNLTGLVLGREDAFVETQ